MEQILILISQNMEMIVTLILGLVGTFLYRNRDDKKDAVASLKSAAATYLRENPELKQTLSDGKITSEEWKAVFAKVGPDATGVATKAGAKVLNRWIGKEHVANKYIEAVTREMAKEFDDA